MEGNGLRRTLRDTGGVVPGYPAAFADGIGRHLSRMWTEGWLLNEDEDFHRRRGRNRYLGFRR